MANEDKPFKNEKLGMKIVIVITISLLIIFSIGFVIGIYYFGILGIFKLLGVQYESFSSLFLFVVLYFLLGLIGDLIIKAFMILLSKIPLRNSTSTPIEFFIYFLVNWSIISILNFFMQSIDISFITQVLAALIIAIIELTLDRLDKKNS